MSTDKVVVGDRYGVTADAISLQNTVVVGIVASEISCCSTVVLYVQKRLVLSAEGAGRALSLSLSLSLSPRPAEEGNFQAVE